MSSSRLSMRASTGESGMRVLPEAFKHRLLQLSEETVDSLQKIWAEAGYEEVEKQRLLGDLLNKLKMTCANEMAAEQQILQHARQEVETLTASFAEKNAQLGRKPRIDHLSPMTLTDKLAELDRLITEIDEEVNSRQAILDKEYNAMKARAIELGEAVPSESSFSGPSGTPWLSDVRLKLLKEGKLQFENKRSQRRSQVESLFRECFAHMQDMKYLEESELQDSSERAKFAELDNKIVRFCRLPSTESSSYALPLSANDVALITSRVERLLSEKENRRRELASSGEEIARLWSLLRIPSTDRMAFSSSFEKNLSLSTLNKGRVELKRLRDLRQSSLSMVLHSLATDITVLWSELGMTTPSDLSNLSSSIAEDDVRKVEFPLFFTCAHYFFPTEQTQTAATEGAGPALDEDTVTAFESYYHTLRTTVDDLRPLLVKINKREVIINERLELETLMMNPERLTARGPNAREERKREENMSTRVKNLDKLNKEVEKSVKEWEEANHRPFIYGSMRYLDRMIQQDEAYVELKENLRMARKRGKELPPLTVSAGSFSNGNNAGSNGNNMPPPVGLGAGSNKAPATSVNGGNNTSFASNGSSNGNSTAVKAANGRPALLTHAHSYSTPSTPSAACHGGHHARNGNGGPGTLTKQKTVAAFPSAVGENTAGVANKATGPSTAVKNRPRSNSAPASPDQEKLSSAASSSNGGGRESDGSQGTLKTSLTEKKEERHSGGSVTVVKEQIDY